MPTIRRSVGRLLEGHASTSEARHGAGQRPDGAHSRRAAHRPRSRAAPPDDRVVPRARRSGASACSCRATCSTRWPGSGREVLVIAQGRLAASGDYQALRDLMDDRPHRIRIAVDDARTFAATLLARALVDGASMKEGIVGRHRRRRCVRSSRRRSLEGARHPTPRSASPRRRSRVRVPVPGGATMSGSVSPLRAVGLTHRLLVRQLVTRGRVAALLALGPSWPWCRQRSVPPTRSTTPSRPASR